MDGLEDRQLLRQYVVQNDSAAFAALVQRYISLVHNAARRQTRDSHLADDVTQAVFILLARKAATIRPDAALAAWLFAVTRHAAQNAMKIRSRQVHYETRAASQRAESIETDHEQNELRLLLDDAIARLPQLEQTGVLMHFFQQRTHQEIGAALGLSAEAARKRISRALDKMREFLGGRGVTVGATALVAGLHAESASAVTPALVQSTVNIAVLSASNTAAAATNSTLIAKRVSQMYTIAKLKAAAVIALCCGGLAVAAVPFGGLLRTTSTVVTTTTITSAAEKKFVAEVSDSIKVELVGVAPFQGAAESWFDISGDPIDPPALPGDGAHRVMAQPPPEHQILVRIDMKTDAHVAVMIPAAMMVANARMKTGDPDGESTFFLSAFALQNAADETALTVGIADEPWKNNGELKTVIEGGAVNAGDSGTFQFSPVREAGAASEVEISSEGEEHNPTRVIAIDKSGAEVESKNVNVQSDGVNVTRTYTYDVPAEKIEKFVVQGRKFTKMVEVRNISLKAGHKTEPVIEVKKVD